MHGSLDQQFVGDMNTKSVSLIAPDERPRSITIDGERWTEISIYVYEQRGLKKQKMEELLPFPIHFDSRVKLYSRTWLKNSPATKRACVGRINHVHFIVSVL